MNNSQIRFAPRPRKMPKCEHHAPKVHAVAERNEASHMHQLHVGARSITEPALIPAAQRKTHGAALWSAEEETLRSAGVTCRGSAAAGKCIWHRFCMQGVIRVRCSLNAQWGCASLNALYAPWFSPLLSKISSVSYLWIERNFSLWYLMGVLFKAYFYS